MARAVARGHRRAALARVQRKGASPGLDGMPVAGVPGDGRAPWPRSREARWAGPAPPSRGNGLRCRSRGAGDVHAGGPPGGTGSSRTRGCRGGSRPGPRPGRRAATAAVRGGRSRALGAPATAGDGRAASAVPSANGLHRTAGDVTRRAGGVGGERLRGLPLSRFAAPGRESVILRVDSYLRR
jgi:hypothetical protein